MQRRIHRLHHCFINEEEVDALGSEDISETELDESLKSLVSSYTSGPTSPGKKRQNGTTVANGHIAESISEQEFQNTAV